MNNVFYFLKSFLVVTHSIYKYSIASFLQKQRIRTISK